MATAELVLRIGLEDNGRTMKLEEFLNADWEDGYLYELARGVLEVTYVPPAPHGMIVYWFYIYLADYRREYPDRIYRFGGGGEFRFWLPTMISSRHPDVGVVLRNAPRDPRGERSASLAIEVVSQGEDARTRDYATKREEYLAYGLREYWIVDPFALCVTVLLRDGDAWVERTFKDDQSAQGLVLPGFVMPLAELWEKYREGDEETPG